MQLDESRVLTVLAEELNMRKASERLFVSQPALSQRLQSMEKYWGTKIFIRSQKGLTLTPGGERIIEYAKEIVKKEEAVREELQAMDAEVHGTLKLAAASIIGQYWLPRVLKEFVNRYPYVKISLVTGWSSEMLKHIYEDQVHIGIIRGDPDWRGVKMPLISDPLYLVDKEITKLDDIKETARPFIQFKSDSNYYQQIQNWWHRQFKVTPKRTIVVDQIETCKQMVLNGIGYAILPGLSLNEQDDLTKISLKGETGEYLTRPTWLIGYEAAFELKQVQAFLKVIEEMSP